MKNIRGKSLNEIKPYHMYEGCTFYLDPNEEQDLIHNDFTNCSFRSRLKIKFIYMCNMENCSFSSGANLNFEWIHHDLSYFPKVLMPHIRTLNMASSMIRDENNLGKIRQMKNIEVLNLSNNFIRHIPPAVYDLKHLRELDISSTNISDLSITKQVIEANPETLSTLRVIKLVGLDIDCASKLSFLKLLPNLRQVWITVEDHEMDIEEVKSFVPKCLFPYQMLEKAYIEEQGEGHDF